MLPATLRPHALASILGLGLLASGCGGVVHPAAATVGSVKISDGELRATIPVLKFLAGLQQIPCGQAGAGERASAACTRFALSELIQGEAAKTYAAQNHVSLPKGELANTLTSVESRFGGQKQLVAQLRGVHVSFGRFSALVSEILLVDEVAREVTVKDISTRQLEAAYRQQLPAFTELHAAHILVKSEHQAKRIAERVTPKTFAALAKRYSIDPTGKQGGDLGTFRAAGSNFDPTFVQAADALQPGQISAPVHTRFGWHVIYLISKTVVPFSQAKLELVARFAAQGFTKWLAHDAGGVSVNPRYGAFDPSSGRVQQVCSTSATTPCPSPTPSGSGSATP